MRNWRGATIPRLRWLLPLAALLLAGCPDPEVRPVAHGDPGPGRALIRTYGCHACHVVPGVRGADKLVGPPLVRWSERVYIAGRVPNTPENLVLFIMHPQAIHERTAMPNMGVTEQDARHIAAYLFTLR